MSSPEFRFNLHPLTPAELPSEEVLVKATKAILDASRSWKEGSSYHNNTVRTFSCPKLDDAKSGDEATWYCRFSVHPPEQLTFDECRAKLIYDKAENEMKFVDQVKKVQLIKQLSPTMSIWTIYYNFGSIFSSRIFTVLQVIDVSTEGPRRAVAGSIPIDLSNDPELLKLEGKGVRGRYAHVEEILELPNGGVEWRMATSSTPGGAIPQVLAEAVMAQMISEDVPKFLKFMNKT